jgi:hypothetical protein
MGFSDSGDVIETATISPSATAAQKTNAAAAGAVSLTACEPARDGRDQFR